MSMFLDLRVGGKLSKENNRLYNECAEVCHKSFNNLIDSISELNGDRIDWWVSSPASRNTILSPLFHYCCCLLTIKELLIDQHLLSEIIVDSREFKILLDNYFVQSGYKINVTLTKVSIKDKLRSIAILLLLPFKYLLRYYFAKYTNRYQKKSYEEPMILVDTFVIPNYIDSDRYYPGILNFLTKAERSRIWFVPEILGFSLIEYCSVSRRLRESDVNFMLKDDFLKFQDYWCIWRYFFRIRNISIEPINFHGFDLSSLIGMELKSIQNVRDAYDPLLNYNFFKRLSERDVKLQLAIDWFENQSIDKGWNKGLSYYYPQTMTIGYQGYIVSPHYLCVSPTKMEYDSEVIPKKIAVMGDGLISIATKNYNELNVEVAPAFRFQHLWEDANKKIFNNLYNILVVLPIMFEEANYLIKIIQEIEHEIPDNCILKIKSHPSVSLKKYNLLPDELSSGKLQYIAGPMNDYISSSRLVISSASSAIMECLANGIPTIVIGNRYGLTHNPIPESVPSEIWKLCYDRHELIESINHYYSMKPDDLNKIENIGRMIRKDYFNPVTEIGGRKLLDLSTLE